MDLQKISLSSVQGKRVAILGYGNQGRTHALNLRDSGVSVCVGVRIGKGAEKAKEDGFHPVGFEEAVSQSDIVVFLLADHVIPEIYRLVTPLLPGKLIGFAHGFCFHFGLLEKIPRCHYFLVAPKGPGATLRKNFEKGGGLPGAFAVEAGAPMEIRELATAYAKAIGVAGTLLLETTFQEETECDLFGEQAVLCGGIPELIQVGIETLVKKGHSEEMAFLECCFEAKIILDLLLEKGPRGMADAISPTALYGGMTRGKRVVDETTREKLDALFDEIRSGTFAREWMKEVGAGFPTLTEEKRKLGESRLEKVWGKWSGSARNRADS